MKEFVLTTSGLAEILSQISELSEYDISVSEMNDSIQIGVGDSVYAVKSAETIDAPEDVVESLSEINDEIYESFDAPYIQSGVIKELVKTLAVGGLVRLTTKLLKG